MPPVIQLNDAKKLVDVSQFPSYAKFNFGHFNPVQSRVFEVFREDANCIIAAATSAGKTVCAEMFIANEVRERSGKAMYLSPLKALAKEKIDDWTSPNHHFYDLNLSICTGDYQLTIDRKKELESANIILLTSEMLNSRVRNFTSEQNDFLRDVNTIVVDESHLLTVPSRGDKLEVGLMKFCKINPNARLVFLSATMPNVKEIAEWVSYALTGKKTYLVNSTYRPCPLEIHYDKYRASNMYSANEVEKVNRALEIVEDYPDDKFLIFAHTKNTGQMMKNTLLRAGIETEFHNADLDKDKRHKLEDSFRSRKLSVIVATSTLAWGLNLPARRVIILGVHRGLSEVESSDIIQMSGRAGRVGLDPCGDVHILLPDNKYHKYKSDISRPSNIKSRLLDYVGEYLRHYKTLAFHLVSEIHHGIVTTIEDIHSWYEKSLACFQANDLNQEIIDSTLSSLMKCGAIYKEDDEYKVTNIGKVSSMFYYSPFDVADLRRNFDSVFENGYESNDIFVSMALGNIDTIRMGIISRAERDEMEAYARTAHRFFPTAKDTAVKGGYAYWALLNGRDAGPLSGFMRNLQFDFPRLAAVLKALDSMSGQWGKTNWFDKLELRASYGVTEDLLEFCMIPNIGKVRAKKLKDAGLDSLEMIAENRDNCVGRALNMKPDAVSKIVLEAKKKTQFSHLLG